MNKSNNPYENNSYLKKDEEVLKEVLFFERFGLKQTKEIPNKIEEVDEELKEDVDK